MCHMQFSLVYFMALSCSVKYYFSDADVYVWIGVYFSINVSQELVDI